MIKTYNAEAVLNEDGTINATSRGFNFLIDPKAGGNAASQGMTPVDAWLNGVAACELASFNMHAKVEGFEFTNAKIVIESQRDSLGGENRYFGLTEIIQHFYIQTPEDNNAVTKIVKSSQERCPLADTLKRLRDVKIQTVIHVVR